MLEWQPLRSKPEWLELDESKFAQTMARQGVRTVITQEMDVVSQETLEW